MPWAKKAQERAEYAFKETIEEIYGEFDFKAVSNDILLKTEMLRRTFSKRQRIIIRFIEYLSNTLRKPEAVIPRIRDFELAGIPANKVTNELDSLIEMNVIGWNRENNSFWLINPTEWKAPYNRGYNDHRLQELLILNLVDKGTNVTPIIQKLNEEDENYFFS